MHFYDFNLKIKIGKVTEKLTMAFAKPPNKRWLRKMSVSPAGSRVSESPWHFLVGRLWAR